MMKQAAYYEDVTDEGRIIRLTGNLSLACLGELPDRLTALPDDVAALDLSGVEHIDTIGAWLIHRTARDRDVRISGANADAKRLIEVVGKAGQRSEEHTSELQSLMRISYAVFCLKKKKTNLTYDRKDTRNDLNKIHTDEP